MGDKWDYKQPEKYERDSENFNPQNQKKAPKMKTDVIYNDMYEWVLKKEQEISL